MSENEYNTDVFRAFTTSWTRYYIFTIPVYLCITQFYEINTIVLGQTDKLFFSFWLGYNDLQRSGVRRVLRSTFHVSLLHDPQGRQPSPPDGVHFYADVLHFYELSSKAHKMNPERPR